MFTSIPSAPSHQLSFCRLEIRNEFLSSIIFCHEDTPAGTQSYPPALSFSFIRVVDSLLDLSLLSILTSSLLPNFSGGEFSQLMGRIFVSFKKGVSNSSSEKINSFFWPLSQQRKTNAPPHNRSFLMYHRKSG